MLFLITYWIQIHIFKLFNSFTISSYQAIVLWYHSEKFSCLSNIKWNKRKIGLAYLIFNEWASWAIYCRVCHRTLVMQWTNYLGSGQYLLLYICTYEHIYFLWGFSIISTLIITYNCRFVLLHINLRPLFLFRFRAELKVKIDLRTWFGKSANIAFREPKMGNVCWFSKNPIFVGK